MFPTPRTGRIAIALGTLILAAIAVVPPVKFRLTDLSASYGGAGISFVGDGTRHFASSGAMFHIGGCKFVGQTGICSSKELTYDHAHGVRFVASVTMRPPGTI